jgi:hypothetical protein
MEGVMLSFLWVKRGLCEISSSHGDEYEVQNCLLGCTAVMILMMEAARTSETAVDNYFTRQYIPEDNSELQKGTVFALKTPTAFGAQFDSAEIVRNWTFGSFNILCASNENT